MLVSSCLILALSDFCFTTGDADGGGGLLSDALGDDDILAFSECVFAKGEVVGLLSERESLVDVGLLSEREDRDFSFSGL